MKKSFGLLIVVALLGAQAQASPLRDRFEKETGLREGTYSAQVGSSDSCMEDGELRIENDGNGLKLMLESDVLAESLGLGQQREVEGAGKEEIRITVKSSFGKGFVTNDKTQILNRVTYTYKTTVKVIESGKFNFTRVNTANGKTNRFEHCIYEFRD
ncbi:MAG TPA: hypothetical protein PKC28_09970 [Bdellovibrionales bacterium]|nr:hypothetical protein [Bdellovibrionales bacterium]